MVPNNVRLPLTRVDEHFYGQPLARPIRAQNKITGTKYCALIGRSSSFYRSGVVPLAWFISVFHSSSLLIGAPLGMMTLQMVDQAGSRVATLFNFANYFGGVTIREGCGGISPCFSSYFHYCKIHISMGLWNRISLENLREMQLPWNISWAGKRFWNQSPEESSPWEDGSLSETKS